jgi:Electron transfer DM13
VRRSRSPEAPHGVSAFPGHRRRKDATDNETVTRAGFVDLGAMKGNKGDQNYDIPTNVDLGQYQSVTIWCRRFGVNFATAPLTLPKQI